MDKEQEEMWERLKYVPQPAEWPWDLPWDLDDVIDVVLSVTKTRPEEAGEIKMVVLKNR